MPEIDNNRAFVFYDGNNFYHNLKIAIKKTNDITLSVIKPSDIDLFKLSEEICSKFNLRHNKSFYYNSIPDIRDGQDVYYSHLKYIDWVKTLPKFFVKTRKLQKKSTKELLLGKLNLLKELSLCKTCRPMIEKNCLECIGSWQRKEKGIDVMIATDILYHSFKDNCDYCILISGDADFLSVFNLVETIGKRVISAFLYYGYSSEIRKKHKPFLVLKDDLLVKCLKTNH